MIVPHTEGTQWTRWDDINSYPSELLLVVLCCRSVSVLPAKEIVHSFCRIYILYTIA